MTNPIPVTCLGCLRPTVPGPRCSECQREHEAARNADAKRAAYRSPVYRSVPRGGLCWICGQPGSDTLDHVVPLADDPSGGGPDNWRPAHRRCNSSPRRKARALARESQPKPAEPAQPKPPSWWIA
jgi:5-methylcytosine-specific restriction endonuclease McrA